MIIDQGTNLVYFSSLIQEKKEYSAFWTRLKRLLKRRHIKYHFIEGTRDIWCRDYMPIQIDTNQFIRFNFFPDYYLSSKYISKLTLSEEIKINIQLNCKYVDLTIDGGNFVKSSSNVILTEKILQDNPKLSKEKIISILKKEANLNDVFLIPQLPYDITGHADGMVRFVNDTDLLVADYSNESKSWRMKMDKALEKTGLNIILFPSQTSNEKNKDGDYTAKGIYINFLQVKNIILLPYFNMETDDYAFMRTKEIFPNCMVIPILSNEIALDGGVLNCISWNIRSATNTPINTAMESIGQYSLVNLSDRTIP